MPTTDKTAVRTAGAPTPISAFSQGVLRGGFLSISGQGPQDPETAAYLHRGDLAAQTVRTLDNVRAIVEGAGGSFEDIVSLRVYLTEREHFAAMNAVYESYLREHVPSEVFPTRTTIFVTLPHEAMLVEIDAVAILA